MEHCEILEASKTVAGNSLLQSQWARGHWKRTIGNILAVLNDNHAMIRMGLTAAHKCEDLDADDVAQSFAKHVELTAVQRVWSMAPHSDSWSIKCSLCY